VEEQRKPGGETGEELKKKNRRGKQRVRPLYFVFSSNSRAPSSVVTAPVIGHSRREIQGRTGEENERIEEALYRENTNRDTNTENAKNHKKRKKIERRKNRERTEEGSSIEPSASPSSSSPSTPFASSYTR
jgi:hypothetical protein